MVLLGGVGGVWWYVRGAEARNLAMARVLAEQGELRRAQLLWEQAVQVNPGSLPAQVGLAEFYDQVGVPASVERWRAVVEVAPRDDYRWKLAAAALRHGVWAEASEALGRVSPAGQGALEQHRLMAGLELARGAPARATPHLTALVEQAPGNLRYRFTWAAHRLALGDDVGGTRQVLDELARSGPLRVRATLELIADAPRRWPRAADPEALLAAQVLDEGRAVQLRAAGRAGRARLLEHLLAPPLPEPADAAVLVSWLLQQGRERDALGWLAGFPASQQVHATLLAPTAECAVRVRDWERLEEMLRHGAWGVIAPGLLRDAFALHRRNTAGDRVRWQQMLEDPEAVRAALRVLWQLARVWGWAGEAELTAGVATRRHPQERWAWEARRAALLQRGASAELPRLLLEWERAGAAPEEAVGERWLVLLLAGQEEPKALAGAESYAATLPATPSRLAVRALLERRAGRGGEALALLETGRPARGAAPPRWWLTYAILLAENGRPEEARRARAKIEEPLLPEEEVLLARVAIARPRTP